MFVVAWNIYSMYMHDPDGIVKELLVYSLPGRNREFVDHFDNTKL